MVQPGNSFHLKVGAYPFWAADNGAFTKRAGGFSAEAFRAMLAQPELQAHAGQCLFVVAPDRLEVLSDGTVRGDAIGTLERFPEWAREIRGHGFPVALVAQNGLELLLDQVPWDLVDVLFIGGNDEWKEGPGAFACSVAAREHGCRVHMGRVNGLRRMRIAASMLCDTADGTFLRFGNPEKQQERVEEKWFKPLREGVQAKLPHT